MNESSDSWSKPACKHFYTTYSVAAGIATHHATPISFESQNSTFYTGYPLFSGGQRLDMTANTLKWEISL